MTYNTDRLHLLTERVQLAYKLRQQGLAFKEIGKRLGVGRAAAWHMHKVAVYKLSQEPAWDDGLGVRIRQILGYRYIKSRSQLLRSFKSGELEKSRNYGWQMHKEVAKWLGLPEPSKPKKKYVKSRATIG
jgi:hypothetical protein